jgi:putative membrane protein
MMDGYYGGSGHMSGWGWVVTVFMMIALLMILAVFVWAVVSRWSPQSSQPQQPSQRSAREILDERLARGEIEPDDYHARLDALAGKKPGQSASP